MIWFVVAFVLVGVVLTVGMLRERRRGAPHPQDPDTARHSHAAVREAETNAARGPNSFGQTYL